MTLVLLLVVVQISSSRAIQGSACKTICRCCNSRYSRSSPDTWEMSRPCHQHVADLMWGCLEFPFPEANSAIYWKTDDLTESCHWRWYRSHLMMSQFLNQVIEIRQVVHEVTVVLTSMSELLVCSCYLLVARVDLQWHEMTQSNVGDQAVRGPVIRTLPKFCSAHVQFALRCCDNKSCKMWYDMRVLHHVLAAMTHGKWQLISWIQAATWGDCMEHSVRNDSGSATYIC